MLRAAFGAIGLRRSGRFLYAPSSATPSYVCSWAVRRGDDPAGPWQIDRRCSPLRQPTDLTSQEQAAGLGVNFWRHHLLVTPAGQARIYFNSGKYGTEQMYSMICNKPIA